MFLLRHVVQQNAFQRFQRKFNALTLDGELSFIIEGVNKNSVCKIAYVEGNKSFFVTRTVERDKICVIFSLLVENVAPCTNHAGISKNIVIRRQRQKFARPQNNIFITCRNKFFIRFAQFIIAVFPIIRSTVRRIFKALQSDFIAVVNTGNAGICHLPQRRHFQARLAEFFSLRVKLERHLLSLRHMFIVGRFAKNRNGAQNVMTRN